MDFDEAGLLDGMDGHQREQRIQLLERLTNDGYDLDELRRAVREDRLALLPVEQVLGGTLSARDIEQATGLPAETIARVRRLHGLPDAALDADVYADEDVEAARAIKAFMEAGFDEERIAEITRVLGEGMARLAATITVAFAQTFLRKGDSEEEVAMRFADLAEQLTPATSPILAAAFRAHLRDSVGRAMLGQAELASGDLDNSQELYVCFADVVGFTRLSSRVDTLEVGTIAGRLYEVAAAAADPPVRLVKTIGDAAMFVSPEPGPLVDAALELVEAFERDDLPPLRAGIAFGMTLQRAGDYYGNAVNLASRVTGVARPGSVLATQEVRDAASDAHDWSSAGRHRLKGVKGHSSLYRARRHRDERR